MSEWNEYVANGQAFSAEDFIIGSGGLYPHLQLFNPVDSGIRVRLKKMSISHTVIRQANVRRYDPPGAILGPPAPFVIENLLGSGPAAVAEIRHANIVIPSGSGFWLLQAGAFVTRSYPVAGLEWGHDLLEGNGILLQGSAGTTLIATFQWVELPNE